MKTTIFFAIAMICMSIATQAQVDDFWKTHPVFDFASGKPYIVVDKPHRVGPCSDDFGRLAAAVYLAPAPKVIDATDYQIFEGNTTTIEVMEQRIDARPFLKEELAKNLPIEEIRARNTAILDDRKKALGMTATNAPIEKNESKEDTVSPSGLPLWLWGLFGVGIVGMIVWGIIGRKPIEENIY